MRNDSFTAIGNKVIQVIADVLDKPVENISIHMKLFSDLWVESVETLEIGFALEQEFDIKIDKTRLWNTPNFILENNLFNNGAFLTEGIELIKRSLRNVSDAEIAAIQNPHDLLKYLSIHDIAQYIFEDKMREEVALES